jgi:hypothetical protein
MTVETLSELPVTVFSSWVTLVDPSSVPPGLSPNCADVEFTPQGVRTRPGLVSQFSPLGGFPAVNGLKTYITPNQAQRLLVLDGNGTLYKEFSPGALGLVASLVAPGSLMASATHFGREYMAFSNGAIGQDIPRQFDDLFFDRVSQTGPGEGPAVVDSSSSGNITAGVHQVAVAFVTRQGYITAPSPVVSWTAAGGKKAHLTNIPTGPSNVVERMLLFTAAGGANFFNIPATMTIHDNTTTSLDVDFTDAILVAGETFDSLFGQLELPSQLGVIDYAERLFWWGELAKMDNWSNVSFDGGWDASGNGRPLGWTLDSTFGAGGSRESSQVIFGDAYRITADGVTAARGMIFQNAISDPAGNPRLQSNTGYSIRARVMRTAGLNAGTFRITAFSPSVGQFGASIAVTAAEAATTYQNFTAQLFGPQSSLPPDLILRVYADGVPAPSGEAFIADNIEIFPTAAPQNNSIVRASATAAPESYDGVTGLVEVAVNNGEALRAAFKLRNNLYFVKERSLYVTATDGANEPALWPVEEVSASVGTPSVHGVGYGEGWVVITGRSGIYFFDGGEPLKISQEIQPAWDQINWQAGESLWVEVDTRRRQIFIGVPMGAATAPNQILMLDYSQGFQDPLAALPVALVHTRKWAPWNIAANCAGLIERPDGTAQLFLGSNNSSGKIYALTNGQFSDDGAAINSFYSTAFLAATGSSGRNQFGYLTANVQGAGTLAVSAILPGGTSSVPLGAWTLTSPATSDRELYTNVLAERIAYQAGTNAPGSWFSLSKLAAWVKPDPFAFVRGT